MNLLLLDPDELSSDGRARLSGRRARHLVDVLGAVPGATVRAGMLGRAAGEATVVEIAGEGAAVEVELDCGGLPEAPAPALPPPPVRLTLALPRPKALGRILRSAATLGLARLDLTNAWRVEKSYFSSPALEPASIRRELLLGAEQGATTQLPDVTVHRFLMGFFDSLAEPAPGEHRLLAHPREAVALERAVPPGIRAPVHLALGPEGGWTERELATFPRYGFSPVTLGPWVLTSGEAVVAALAQLALLGRLG